MSCILTAPIRTSSNLVRELTLYILPFCQTIRSASSVGRFAGYRKKVEAGTWKTGQSLSNNVLRRFKTLCKRAKVKIYSVHDLRRSCITNWAKKLPVHVVQLLAGHSDIKTTQTYYLSVQQEDIRKAQLVQSQMLGKIPEADLTDPKVTHFGKIRAFPGKDTGCRKS